MGEKRKREEKPKASHDMQFTTKIRFTTQTLIDSRYQRASQCVSSTFQTDLSQPCTVIVKNKRTNNDKDLTELFNLLNMCHSTHVSRVSGVKKGCLVLNEDVINSGMAWIMRIWRGYNPKANNWSKVSGEAIRKVFRGLALAMLYMHDHGIVFEGDLSDVVITPSTSKAAYGSKPRSSDFDQKRVADIHLFIHLITRCMTLPQYEGSFQKDFESLTPAIIKKCGLSQEDIWYLTQLESQYDNMVPELPSSLVLENPFLYGVEEKRTFVRKLSMDVLNGTNKRVFVDLDKSIKKKRFLWKNKVSSDLVQARLKFLDMKRGVKGVDQNLGRDLILVPWTADKHARSDEIKGRLSGNKVYQIVDEDIGTGFMTLFYGELAQILARETVERIHNWCGALYLLRSTYVDKGIWEERIKKTTFAGKRKVFR